MSRAKSARVFSEHERISKRVKLGRSMSLAPVGSRERVRSAMGEYVGERPLSAAYHPTPGPADYHPKVRLSLPNPPSYSLHGRPDPPRSAPVHPCPSSYDTSKDLNWTAESSKTITLKKKDITWPYDTRKYAEITVSPGAGHYRRRDSEVGCGPKRSLSARHREGIHAGYPNALIAPVDTLGFLTPGPYLFRPESERGPNHVLGMQLKKDNSETLGPGPAAYSLPAAEVAQAPMIGERLDRDMRPVTPAPNKYQLPSSIRPASASGKSIGVRREIKSAHVTPPPNVYTISRPQTASAHFTYRTFPGKSEQRPGPEYEPGLAGLPTSPEYSCRTQCKPVYPDVLQYPENATTVTPGAGAYEYDREFEDNDNPAYSIALPLPQKPNENPAPNQYDVKHSSLSSLRRPPSCKLGQRLTHPSSDHKTGPGPAAYYIRQDSSKCSGVITPRRSPQKASPGPAPNAYTINRGTTAKGRSTGTAASMKSRHTPHRYSGFPCSYLNALQTLS